MNALISTLHDRGRSLVAVAMAATLLVACSSAPVAPAGAADARAKLNALQMHSELAARVPVAMREAEAAVALAEQPVGDDSALGAHRVLMADRRVEIAIARAATSAAEARREQLAQDSAGARLAARTNEADRSRDAAATARSDAQSARADSERARRAAEQAREAAAAESEGEAARLREQIRELEARETDRGLVLTLGDVLFETGKSELRAGATSNLAELVAFLKEYEQRTVLIEGHTDDVGTSDYNQDLSLRRADAVRSWLTESGIDGQRLSAVGKGESQAVADNDTPTGRQMNRRVEVIIEND